jgi:hypothetical protein
MIFPMIDKPISIYDAEKAVKVVVQTSSCQKYGYIREVIVLDGGRDLDSKL